jgi:hypothetical protein
MATLLDLYNTYAIKAIVNGKLIEPTHEKINNIRNSPEYIAYFNNLLANDETFIKNGTAKLIELNRKLKIYKTLYNKVIPFQELGIYIIDDLNISQYDYNKIGDCLLTQNIIKYTLDSITEDIDELKSLMDGTKSDSSHYYYDSNYDHLLKQTNTAFGIDTMKLYLMTVNSAIKIVFGNYQLVKSKSANETYLEILSEINKLIIK